MKTNDKTMKTILGVLGLVACGSYGQTLMQSHLETQIRGGQVYLAKQDVPVSEEFHSISPDTDGFQATRGALTYLLDQNGNTMTRGFHSLTRLDEACNSDYDAGLGTCRYVITADGNVKSINYPECWSKVILECPNPQ